MRVIYIYTQYRHNRWVICRQYTGDLPFTGYLPVVYGPLLSKCTEFRTDADLTAALGGNLTKE